MSLTPHLDEMRARGGLPTLRYTSETVLFINGEFADNVGSLGMQELANEKKTPLIVEAPSKYHQSKIFRPTVKK